MIQCYVISCAEGQPGVIKRYYLLFLARAAPHFFLFLFLFFFFGRFIKVLKKVLMEIGFLYVSTDK